MDHIQFTLIERNIPMKKKSKYIENPEVLSFPARHNHHLPIHSSKSILSQNLLSSSLSNKVRRALGMVVRQQWKHAQINNSQVLHPLDTESRIDDRSLIVFLAH